MPDIAFLSYDRWPGPLPAGILDVAPELAAESVSPSNTWSKMQRTIEQDVAAGVERV
ncbi:MAG: hypothetical protein RMM58_01425 [Chloroflexota bacterium]|nr:hypothetical protein [Chloroflexota bacterium]